MAIDWTTFALQAVNFAILAWLLQRLLYRPVRAAVDRRREIAAHAHDEAVRAAAEAERTRADYEAMCAETQSMRRSVMDAAHAEAAAERARLIADAEQTVRETVAAGERDIARARDQAIRDIQGRTVDLAVDLAGRLLEEAASDGTAETFLDRALAAVAAMPEAERDRVRAALEEEGAALAVAACPMPDAAARDRWRARLGAALGAAPDELPDIRFLDEPRLVAGVELRLPGATVRFAWADTLSRARRELGSDDGD